jgi:pimeloyl-ACP methyl ester carboxylesterase
MKTAFIINGLDTQVTANDDEYKSLRQAVAAKGYVVKAVDISWKQATPTQYAHKFISYYEKHKSPDYNVVIGNSFGAVVAILTAVEIKPDLILLCSLSPFFKEDKTKTWPPQYYDRLIGKQRLKDISSYSIQTLADNINLHNIIVKVLYGEREHISSPRLVKRAQDTAKLLHNSTLVEIPDASHNFNDAKYIKGIIDAL